MTAAHDGTNYYTSNGGGGGSPYTIYSGSGVFISSTSPSPGIDFRSIFTDGSGNLFARGYASTIVYQQTSFGTFTPHVTLVGGSLDSQAAVVLNGAGTGYIANNFGLVSQWNLSGTFTGSFSLSGFGGSEAGYPSGRNVAATGSHLFTYDATTQTVSAWDYFGTRVDTAILTGAGTGFNSGFSFSYANGLFFVVDSAGGTWRGYAGLGGCPVGAGNDTCLIDSTTNQATAIDADGGTDTLQVGGATNFNFNVAGIGTTFTNFETFQKVGASDVTLTGTATTGVDWDVQAGTLTASGGSSIGDTNRVIVGSGAFFSVANSETIGRLDVNGTVNLNGNNLDATDGLNGGSGVVNLGGGTLTVTGSYVESYAGAINGTGQLVNHGGELNLYLNQPLNADVTNDGRINFWGGQINGEVHNNAGAIYFIGATVSGDIDGAGTILNYGGMTYLSGNNTNTGLTQVFDGTLVLQGGQAIGDASSVLMQTSGGNPILALDSSETIGSLQGFVGLVTLGGNTLTTGGAGSTTFAGTISGAGNLTKVGASTFTVNGAQLYTGLTSINAGEINLNGSLAGAVNIASGATFSGDATIAGTVTNLGAVDPGNSPGTQHYLGDYAGGGVFNMEVLTNLGGAPVNGTTHDFVDIDGNVTGTTIINLFPSGLPTVTSGFGFELVRVGGSVASNAFQLAGGSLTYSGFYYLLNYVADFSGTDDGFFLYTAPLCTVDNANNSCLIDATTPQSLPINALLGSDTLQLGGAVGFNFNVAGIGTTYTNFETFQKIGASNANLTGVAGVAANWDIQAGTLTASTGNNIFNTSTVNVGGAGTFAVSASETIGKLTGTGITTLASGQTLTTGDASNHSYAGTTSGLGGLTKTGTGKFSTLSLGHTGVTTVAAGELNTNGTIGGSVQINAGATLSGNNTISGNLTNLGTLKSGNSPGTTTVVGNYIGGGVMSVEVQFSNAGAPVNGTTHDLLTIGGTATGPATLLNIIPFAPSGAAVATTGNGIELVRVGTGTPGAGQFALAAPVFLGSYQYVLNYVSTVGPDSYFLKSQTGEGMYGEAAMFSAGQAMTGACFRGTDELVGDGTRDTKGRGWAKVSTGNRSTGPDTGIDSEQDFSCGSGGVDVRVAGSMRAGISGGYGNTDVDVQTLAGVGKLDGDGGMIQGFLGYAHEHMFANLSLGYGNINWNFDGPLTAPVTATTGGAIGSLQAGALWPMGDWRLGAMAELGYDDMTCGDQCLLAGTVEDINNWSVKGTLRVDGTMDGGKLMPFLAVSLSEGGSNTVTNGTATITTDTASSLLSAKAGITMMVGSNTAVFLNGGITEGLSNEVSGADGTAGVKLYW